MSSTTTAVAHTLSFARSIDVRDALQNEPPQPRFVLHGLARRYAGGLIAAGSTGKSQLGLAIGCEVSSGGAYHDVGLVADGLPPSKVLYVSAEEDDDVLRGRVHRLGTHLPADVRELICENFDIASTLGLTPSLVDRNLEPNEVAIAELIAYLADYALVIFDPLRKFHEGDENSSADMTAVTKVFDRIAVGADCALLFTHHVNKGALRGGTTDQSDAARGSVAITDNIRLQLNMSRLSDNECTEYGLAKTDASWYVALDFAKTNHIAPEGTRILRRRADGTLYRDELTENHRTIATSAKREKRAKIVSLAPAPPQPAEWSIR